MGETEVHRDGSLDSIRSLQAYFADSPDVCVSGNLLIHYERGNRRRHVSPDVFVVLGVPRRRRDYYLLWEEGKGPDLVIELTSPSTRNEDLKKKFALYRDILGVREYFLFDPKSQYLKPRLQGYRLVDGQYVPIEPVEGRLPSEILSLHLEGVGTDLRFYDPTTALWLPREHEIREALEQSEVHRIQEQAARQQAEAARQQAEAENERLRRELEELRRERTAEP